MAWEKMSQEAARKLAGLVEGFECQKKPMFGHEVYWINGNMFAGVFASDIWIRLARDDQADFFEAYEDAKLFEPMPGRSMKDYVVLPESVLENEETAKMWLERAYRHTASLPEKKVKAKKG
ncbi:TfoX/Sxy family protein [Methanocella sp. MCL-LM]|uniref:TfoX/Sxy family protein n=1 Tax=Methanocella sp. MCL-LM TaxID=3412035 RepID=UPI003C71571A